MFAGGRRRSSNNIRTMQLFHELKQQFPTVPDNIVLAYINHANNKSNNNNNQEEQVEEYQQQRRHRHTLEELLDIGSKIGQQEEEPMGRTSTKYSIEPALSLLTTTTPSKSSNADTTSSSHNNNNNSDKNDNGGVSNGCKNSNNQVRRNNTNEESIRRNSNTATEERRTNNTDEMDKCASSDVNRNVVKKKTSECHTKDNDDEDDDNNNNNDDDGDGDDNDVRATSGDVNVNNVDVEGKSSSVAKRPDTLNIRNSVGDFNNQCGRQIQPSGRCSDIHKLLNSENVNNNKPPRSPISNNSKKFANLRNSTFNRNEHFSNTNNNNNIHCKSPTITSSPTTVSGSNPLDATSTKRHSSTSPFNNNNNNNTIDNSISSNLHNNNNNNKKTEQKRETADTPTQTTDTLLGPPSSNGLNLSLNVNCSMDLMQSPTARQKCSTSLHIVPQQPWCQDPSQNQRSYTSVNLTLRPPSSEPQPPIDITSQNSSLTYSTSSFDSQKGLASRLEITVGPTGTGSVSSLRVRPRSSYHPETTGDDVNPIKAGSLPDLAGNMNPSVIIKQQARIEKLKIELTTEKTKLIAMQQDIADLENMENNAMAQKLETKLEQQLLKEIKHLRGQCERLTLEVDRQSESRVPLGETNEEFYRHIYTGQRLPVTLMDRRLSNIQNMISNQYRMRSSSQLQNERQQQQLLQHQLQQQYLDTIEGPKWNCHMCTFQNHPLLDKCEQCEMPRILHGMNNSNNNSNNNNSNRRHNEMRNVTASTSTTQTAGAPQTNPDPSIAFSMIRPIGQNVPYSPNQMWNLSNRYDGVGDELDDSADSRFLQAFDKIFNKSRRTTNNNVNSSTGINNLNHSQSANNIYPTRTENVFNRNLSIPNHLITTPINANNNNNNNDNRRINFDRERNRGEYLENDSGRTNNRYLNNTKTCNANC